MVEEHELVQKVEAIHDIVKEINKNLESAFPKDEDNNVDYYGHRLYHRKAQQKETTDKKSTSEFKVNIYTWAFIGVATLILNAISYTYVVPVIKQVVGGG